MGWKNYSYSILFVILLFTLSSCKSIGDYTSTTATTSTSLSLNYEAECRDDNDCSIGGCSSQVCGEKNEIKNIITTCEYKAEYECLKKTNCGCVNDKCLWKENPEYSKCLEEKRENEI